MNVPNRQICFDLLFQPFYLDLICFDLIYFDFVSTVTLTSMQIIRPTHSAPTLTRLDR